MEFVYVKPVDGHLVPRYSTVSMDSPTYIGATRVGKVVTWDLESVVRISLEEWTRYGREYRRAVASGGLMMADEAAYLVHQEAREAESKAAEAEAKPVVAATEAKAAEVQAPATEAKPAEDAKKKTKKTTSSEGEQ